MELDYIDQVNSFGESFVRLYGFNKAESLLLSQTIVDWLNSAEPKLNLGSLEFITPRNCNLVLCKAPENDGILSQDDSTFYCLLNADGYKDLLQALAPFTTKETKGFAYLYDIDTPIDLLYSPAGTW